jgi:GTP-binding protein
MTKAPVVAIVGRPNVGKSSLLNSLVGKRISIVQDQPGVTRDRVSTFLPIATGDGTRFVELVDTGGYGFVDPDALTEHIRHQIDLAMARADLVLFLVDAQEGVTVPDEEVAGLLRRKGIRAVLIANKADGPRVDAMLGDFARLGLGTPIGVSAMNDRNIDQVIDSIAKNVDLAAAPAEVPEPEMLVAIVGKRNAGKSTLVNSIAQIYEGDGERVIVSEVPGTTRDSIDVRFEKEGKTLVVIDTAGVRKKRHMVTNDIEFYSFHRAQRSVRRADVVLLLIDATEPVSEPDKKLAQYVAEQFKPVAVVVNKWDLALERLRQRRRQGGEVDDDRDVMEKYRQYLDEELRWLDYAPIAFITAKEGRNVQVVLDLCQHLFNQARTRVPTSRLNQAVRQILQERSPSTPTGRKAKVFYATQVETTPPTIVLVVNNPAFVDETYQRFMINRLRELLPYDEVPIRLTIKARGQRTKEKALDELGEGELPGRETPARKNLRRDVSRKPAGVKHGPLKAKHGRESAKPHPKRAARRGPVRGIRPKR